jgi:hypothetical protein
MYPSAVSVALCLAGITAGGSNTERPPTVSSEANSSRVVLRPWSEYGPAPKLRMFNFAQFVLLFEEERGVPDMVCQGKIAPPDPLPVLSSEPSDVLALERTIESLKQENAWLRERLARVSRVSAEQPVETP